MEINKIYIDSNQKKGKHNNIDNFFLENNLEMIRKRLPIGDYALDLDEALVYVDTKRNWDEVGQNLFSKTDKIRFEKELERAYSSNMPLIILIESDIALELWKNPRNTYDYKSIERQISWLESKYPNVHFVQCAPRSTPFVLLGFLTDTFLYNDDEIERLYQEQENGCAF